MQEASAEIARQMQLLNEEMENERARREGGLNAAQSASDNLTKQLEALSDSLGRMQAAVEQLTGELDSQPQEGNEPEQAMLDM